MIKEIKIENFKSIESLNLELGRLNVFIGANGSGKSNILEGIAFGSAAMEEKVDYEFLANRGIRIADYSSMKSKFDSNQLNNPIFIKWKNEITSWSMLIQNDEKNHDSWKVNGSLEQEIKLVEKKSEKLLKKQFKDNSWIEDLKKSNNDVEDFYVKNFLSAFIDLIEHNGFEPTTMKIPENIRPFFASQIEKNFKDNGAEDFLNFFIFTPENYFLRRFPAHRTASFQMAKLARNLDFMRPSARCRRCCGRPPGAVSRAPRPVSLGLRTPPPPF